MKLRIHWNKFQKKWTSHTYKECKTHNFIYIEGNWVAETKENKKTNPRGFILTDSEYVSYIEHSEAEKIIRKYDIEKLIYDKINIKFNHQQGNKLLFTPNGAFILKEK